MLIEDSFALNIGTTVTNGNLAGPQFVLFDDFVSLAQQFDTFRIRAARFDIYDVNASATIVGWFSTFHDDYTAAAQPVFTPANVLDGPDSLTVPPGTGKAMLYWRSKGTLETSFQPTDGAGNPLPAQYFGGLRYSIPAGGAVVSKYQVVCKVIVDFRGRI